MCTYLDTLWIIKAFISITQLQKLVLMLFLHDHYQKLPIYLIDDTKQTAECQEDTEYDDVTNFTMNGFNLICYNNQSDIECNIKDCSSSR